jgi:large subunit ribosomal protein L22
MGERGFTYTPGPDDSVARARGWEIPMSPKRTYEVLNAIRGLPLERARAILEDAAALKRPIPFRRYNQETAHKRGIGPGRFAVKVCRAVLKVLANAEANAEFEGMDTDLLYVKVAASARGRIQRANMPRAHGRSTSWNEQPTNVEIVLAERKEKT